MTKGGEPGSKGDRQLEGGRGGSRFRLVDGHGAASPPSVPRHLLSASLGGLLAAVLAAAV